MNTIFDSAIKAVGTSLQSVDAKMFNTLLDDCEKALRNGGSVIVSGLGKNAPVCEKFVGCMISLGLRSQFLHTNTAVHGDLGMVHDGGCCDCAVKKRRNARVNQSCAAS